MADREVRYVAGFWPLTFWFFVVVKWLGTLFAAWSWWWVLLPIVPVIGVLVSHFGL